MTGERSMTLNGPLIAVRGPSSTWRVMVFCASDICAHVSGAKRLPTSLGSSSPAGAAARALGGQIRGGT